MTYAKFWRETMYNIEQFLKSYNEGITIDILTSRHENFQYYKHFDFYNVGFVFVVGLWKFYSDDDSIRPRKAVHSSLGEILPIPFNHFDFKDIRWAILQWGNKELHSSLMNNDGKYGKEDMQDFVNKRFSYV